MGDDHNLAFDPIILAFLKYIMNVLGIVGTRKIGWNIWSFPSALVLPISFSPSHQLRSFSSASVLPISFSPSHQLRSFPSPLSVLSLYPPPMLGTNIVYAVGYCEKLYLYIVTACLEYHTNSRLKLGLDDTGQ